MKKKREKKLHTHTHKETKQMVTIVWIVMFWTFCTSETRHLIDYIIVILSPSTLVLSLYIYNIYDHGQTGYYFLHSFGANGTSILKDLRIYKQFVHRHNLFNNQPMNWNFLAKKVTSFPKKSGHNIWKKEKKNMQHRIIGYQQGQHSPEISVS